MRQDSRLSRMLHVLLHMARHDAPFTSEQIGKMLGTNPVVVRRTMAGLRKAGYVRADKGHGGGWSIAVDLAAITLLDVYRALTSPALFMLGSGDPDPACAVERVVNRALATVLHDAEAMLLARLGEVSLSELAGQFDELCRTEGWDQRV